MAGKYRGILTRLSALPHTCFATIMKARGFPSLKQYLTRWSVHSHFPNHLMHQNEQQRR
jgi:hypothetical protein